MATAIPISDPRDPRIAPYVQVRDRDLAGRGDGFIAEGEVVLRVLLGQGARCRAASLLVAEKRLAKLAPLLIDLAAEVPVYVASQAAMDAIVGFPMHRGILAHGLRPPDPGAGQLLAGLGDSALVIALCGIANHDNLGGLFRNAAAFGADAVILDAQCCDPFYRKAIRVSVGAALTLPFARLAPGQDILNVLEAAGFTALALSPGGAGALAELPREGRQAVLFGAEGPGLASEILDRARAVAIPMARGWDSLNVAAASAIVLHHLRRDD